MPMRDTREDMISGRTRPRRRMPVRARRGRGGHGEAAGVRRSRTRRPGLRHAAVFLLVLALGAVIDLREIAFACQDAADAHAAFAAAVTGCGAKERPPPTHPHAPVAPNQEAATLAAALSLSAPLMTGPPLFAAPAAFEVRDPAGQPVARCPIERMPRAHRSRAPPPVG